MSVWVEIARITEAPEESDYAWRCTFCARHEGDISLALAANSARAHAIGTGHQGIIEKRVGENVAAARG